MSVLTSLLMFLFRILPYCALQEEVPQQRAYWKTKHQ